MSIFSQNSYGKVEYSISLKKINFEKRDTIVSEEKKELANFFKSILKKSIERKFELVFNDSISLFAEKIELDNKSPESLIGKSSNDKLFINIKRLEYNNQIEFYGKMFLIKDKLVLDNWILNKENSKKILNFNCYKATCLKIINNKSCEIEAWYTDEIPHSFGPDFYCGLPGIILELKIGDLYYKCESVSFAKVNLKKPNSGKILSQKEFDVIVNQKQIEILGF